MPAFTVDRNAQLAQKGGGGWDRVRYITMTGDATTYQTNGISVSTATMQFPILIRGMMQIATSGSVPLLALFDVSSSTIRLYSGASELGLGNSTAFATGTVIKFWALGY
jgi:hypothetical protein